MSANPLFVNHLFRLRRSRSLSQKRLAYLVGASARAISDFERGRRLPPLRIAMVLEIVLSAKVSEIYVELCQCLTRDVIGREDALPSTAHEIRNRLLGKD